MALESKSYGGDERAFASGVRLCVHHNKVVKIAAAAGAPLYGQAFPLQESATPGTYEPLAAAGEIVAFVAHKAAQTSATGETLHVVMTEGDVHRDDVVIPAGLTQGDVDTALKSAALKSRGFHVQGLADVSL